MTLFRSTKYGTIQKVTLSLFLISTGVISFLPLAWTYKKTYLGIGLEVAQIMLASHVGLFLLMVISGLGIGYLLDWAIHRRMFIFIAPQQGSFAEVVLHLWGYEIEFPGEELAESPQAIEPIPNNDATQDVVTRPRRRGRKPTFPLECWLPIVATWEYRDPIRDAFTLEDLIRAHLGENKDGSPIVSAQTYYSTWRERGLEELQRRVNAKGKLNYSKSMLLEMELNPRRDEASVK